MIIVLRTQFHVYLPLGQRPFSIVGAFSVIVKPMDRFTALNNPGMQFSTRQAVPWAGWRCWDLVCFTLIVGVWSPALICGPTSGQHVIGCFLSLSRPHTSLGWWRWEMKIEHWMRRMLMFAKWIVLCKLLKMIVLDGDLTNFYKFSPVFLSFLPLFLPCLPWTLHRYLLHCIPECYSLATSPVVTVRWPSPACGRGMCCVLRLASI